MLLAAPAVATGPAARASGQPGPALPATVYGVSGTGGLPVETDLAVGGSSVAVANGSGVFVVTASDGAYHRLRLPGYDARLYDSGVPGMALSPDGTRLAYAWHGQLPPSGEAAIPSGIRVLDLVSGAVRTAPVTGAPPEGTATHHGVLAWNLSWAPGSRFVAYEQTPVARFERAWLPGRRAGRTAALVDATTGEQVVDTVGYSGRMPPLASPQGLLVLVDDDKDRREGIPQLVMVGDDGRRRRPSSVSDTPVGRISPDGSRLAQGPGSTLQMYLQRVAGRPHTDFTELLSAGRYPQNWQLDLLGWSSANRLLAVVRPPDRSDRYREQGSARADSHPVSLPPGGDLVTLTLGRHYRTGRIWQVANTRVHVAQVGRITGGDPGTAFSFATDLALQDPPTREFAPPSLLEAQQALSGDRSAHGEGAAAAPASTGRRPGAAGDLGAGRGRSRRSRRGRGARPLVPLAARRGTIGQVSSRPAETQRLRDLALLRRVRDRMDREYAQPLDVEALARGVHMSAGHLSRAVPARLRRVAVLLPDDPADRAGDGPAAPGRPERHRRLLRGRLLVAGHLQHPLHRARRHAAEQPIGGRRPARPVGCRRA